MSRGRGVLLYPLRQHSKPSAQHSVCLRRFRSTKSAIHSALNGSNDEYVRSWYVRKRPWEERGRETLSEESAGEDYFSTQNPHVGSRERNGHHDSESSIDDRNRGDDASFSGGLYHPLINRTSENDMQYSKKEIISKEVLRREDPDALTLRYTTSASEFLYGQTVVTAALMARRRKLYKLYMVGKPLSQNGRDQELGEIEAMAHKAGVPIKRVPARRRPILDKISEGRPHNVRFQHLNFLPGQCILAVLIPCRVLYWRHLPCQNCQ